MTINIFQIDAFTDQLFGGNPAAVCPLNEWLPDATLLNIAKENNLAETAYFIHKHDNVFHLRWFTPEIEIDLCGHATLASAFVILNCLDYNFDTVVFQTLSGELIVSKNEDFLEMDLPSRPPSKGELPEIISKSLSVQPIEVYKARDYVLVYDTENDIQNLKVSASILEQIDLSPGGIIVTAKGNTSDFVSRFFTPGAAVFEDPVTGSAHCTLVPFWADILGKNELHALQISERKGELFCKLAGNRIFIRGTAVKYLQGTIDI
ncbi:PhzF family phenazine biosynthesis protein [Pontimicrobium sp. SW4]|uniref:PhzF family phenazine biosynthesis protein n=1 Tax=Pontimicrobium sp. SW4 TaxID=3153519 RepID=A0AAU7BU92_9FLAO